MKSHPRNLSFLRASLLLLLLLLAARYSFAQAPSCHWATTLGNRNEIPFGNGGENIGCDRAGNTYLIRTHAANALIGGINLNNASPVAVLTRVNKNGYVTSAKELKGIYELGPGAIYKMVVDQQGNSVIAGAIFGQATIDTFHFEPPYQANYLFVAKYSSDGVLLWLKIFPASKIMYLYKGLAVDAAGNIYVNASISNGFAVIGTDTVQTGNVGAMISTTKLDPAGAIRWHRELYPSLITTGPRFGETYSVAADKDENVYIGGGRSDSLFFDPLRQQLVPNSPLPTSGLFVAKYNKDGQFLWMKDVPYLPNFSLATTPRNELLIYGLFGDDSLRYDQLTIEQPGFLLIKCDTAGKGMWCKSVYSENIWTDFKQGISVDDAGNIYTLGARQDNTPSDSLTVGNTLLPLYSGRQYVLKYDPSGAIKWSYSFRYETIDEAQANYSGELVVNGYASKYFNRQWIPDTLGSIIMNPDGKAICFLAKFSEQTPSNIQQLPDADLMQVYPNPTAGLVTVQLSKSSYAQLSVTDQLGRAVYQQAIEKGTSVIQLNLSEQPNGIYFLKLAGSGTPRTQKVLLAR